MAVTAEATDHPTFLFTDLVGFTALAEEEGDERAADVATAFADAVRALLPRHRATEVKALGDGLMLRGECPRHAVALALAIERTARERRLPPVRVGVHTGPAVERRGDFFGTAVNTAARLCQAAGGGEVLVSEAACAAAGELDEVALGPQRLHWVKNLREPVAARPAEALPPAPPPPAAPVGTPAVPATRLTRLRARLAAFECPRHRTSTAARPA